jgi:hypothetical protein
MKKSAAFMPLVNCHHTQTRPVASPSLVHHSCRAHGLKKKRSRQTSAAAGGPISMTTLLEKTLKRELRIQDRAYILAISPLTLKLTLKGKRKGLQLKWEALVSGDAALAAALNASLGNLTNDSPGAKHADPAVRRAHSAQPRRPESGLPGRKRLA